MSEISVDDPSSAQNNKDGVSVDRSEVLTGILNCAEAYFDPLVPDHKNRDLLQKYLQNDSLTAFVVERMKHIEKTNSLWWKDDALRQRMDAEITGGNFILPADPVDRERWSALFYIGACKKHAFSYGNVLISPDYLPSNSPEFEECGYDFGFKILDAIKERREKLTSSPRKE